MKIAILYNYFLPAFSAGGPIQSIANLIRNLNEDFEFYVITSDIDMNKTDKLDVVSNSWQDFENGIAKVFYINNKSIFSRLIIKLLLELKPDKIFVNGIYSLNFSFFPALIFHQKTIMHLRGMLLPGALEQKKGKKKFYIFIFKLVGIHKKIVFCVSDENEKKYAAEIFGNNTNIQVAQNFPAKFAPLPESIKHKNKLFLMSISLISQMKNHEIVLDALSLVKNKVIWHIYGPIKDRSYWDKCKTKIEKLPNNIDVKYMGEVNPNLVYEKLASCQLFILPSQSENFGHALFEAMISGKPIITSHFTPWNQLEINNAGFNVDLNAERIANVIEDCALMDQKQYSEKVNGVRKYALSIINFDQIKKQHNNLFDN